MTSKWLQWCLKSPVSRLFTQPFDHTQIKENIKAPRHWPLWGEFTGHRWIPRTKDQYRGKCPHLMTSSCTPDGKYRDDRTSLASPFTLPGWQLITGKLTLFSSSRSTVFLQAPIVINTVGMASPATGKHHIIMKNIWAPFQYKDRLPQVWDSHVKDKTVETHYEKHLDKTSHPFTGKASVY